MTSQVQAQVPSASTAVLYVSARDGNDAWSGTLPEPNASLTDGPLATFDHARAVVRAIDKRDLRQITVQFRDGSHDADFLRVADAGPHTIRDGVYRLSTPVLLGTADTGTAGTEIVYQAYPGEHPIFSGGIRVQSWTNLGGNTWRTTLPPGTQNFENLFYNGERRLRPRIGGYLGPFNRIAATTPVARADSTSIDANCRDYASGAECFDRFNYNTTAPDPTYAPTVLAPETWSNLVPAAGNLCTPNQGNPNIQGEIEVLVFEQFSTSKLRVSCVDTAKQILYMTGHTAIPGQQNASESGFITGNRIIIENVKSELKRPGQWYLDRSQGQPYTLTYLSQPGENPNHDEVIVP